MQNEVGPGLRQQNFHLTRRRQPLGGEHAGDQLGSDKAALGPLGQLRDEGHGRVDRHAWECRKAGKQHSHGNVRIETSTCSTGCLALG